MTYPYQERAAQLVTDSLEHHATVTVFDGDEYAGPIVLNVEECRIEFAEDSTPHVTATIVCTVPEDQETIDRIDPRLGVRVRIDAGYTYPNLERDVHPLADLHVRTRTISRPANTMTLECASDEALLMDYVPFGANPPVPVAGINEAAGYVIGWGTQPAAPEIQSEFGSRYAATDLAGFEVEAGVDYQDVLSDLAALAEVWIYCDGDRVWRIRPRSAGGEPVHVIEVGPHGTITDSDAAIDREAWANAVQLEFRWNTDTGDKRIFGRAKVANGAYAPEAVGFRMHHATIAGKKSQAQAHKIARTRLKQLITRGRNLAVQAHAAYWIRPGDSVQIQLSTGEPENQIVKRIVFDPIKGLMSVNTRQPLDVTITTGE